MQLQLPVAGHAGLEIKVIFAHFQLQLPVAGHAGLELPARALPRGGTEDPL